MIRGQLSPVALAILCGGPAMAADTFALPQGCDAFVTIQSRSCSVEHHFTCAGDPEGVKRRVSLGEEGLTYVGTTDRESQWLASFYPLIGHGEELADAPADPASLSELLEKGVDRYDFETTSDEVGTTRYVGEDRLTGQIVTIDDVALQQTAYEITAYGADGTELWSSAGNEFVNADWRTFIGGTGTVTVPDGPFDKNDSPVEFIYPGETGFLSANTKFDCGAVLSSAPPVTQKEISNDHL
ncbi:hypothetical protein ACOI1H_10465 [Loktanella sp. DJP18]|uniref:hypothetical protein n=1 Tax=Loktanella sp. DJP18 TaxID=3409788 RepID=UPI003BB75228